jgi:hypothetical protein
MPGVAESAQDYRCMMFAWTGLTIDCADPKLLARFWAGVLNRPITYEMGVTEELGRLDLGRTRCRA